MIRTISNNLRLRHFQAIKEVEGELAELEEEAKSFQPASRTTQADEEDDRKSLNRKLAESLFLLVKKARNQHAWQMPQGQHEGQESLREVSFTWIKFMLSWQ